MHRRPGAAFAALHRAEPTCARPCDRELPRGARRRRSSAGSRKGFSRATSPSLNWCAGRRWGGGAAPCVSAISLTGCLRSGPNARPATLSATRTSGRFIDRAEMHAWRCFRPHDARRTIDMAEMHTRALSAHRPRPTRAPHAQAAPTPPAPGQTVRWIALRATCLSHPGSRGVPGPEQQSAHSGSFKCLSPPSSFAVRADRRLTSLPVSRLRRSHVRACRWEFMLSGPGPC